ncbi:hypothetical protein D9M71_771320 [compost metagenome]
MDIDFRRRNIIREGPEQLLRGGFFLAEDFQQACGAVNAVVKTIPALLDEDVTAHLACEQSTGLLHLFLDQRVAGLPH